MPPIWLSRETRVATFSICIEKMLAKHFVWIFTVSPPMEFPMNSRCTTTTQFPSTPLLATVSVQCCSFTISSETRCVFSVFTATDEEADSDFDSETAVYGCLWVSFLDSAGECEQFNGKTFDHRLFSRTPIDKRVHFNVAFSWLRLSTVMVRWRWQLQRKLERVAVSVNVSRVVNNVHGSTSFVE